MGKEGLGGSERRRVGGKERGRKEKAGGRKRKRVTERVGGS